MSRQIRRFGPLFLTVGALVALALFLVPLPRSAEATSYSGPNWSNNSPSPECGGCNYEPCIRPELFDLDPDQDAWPYCRLWAGWRTGEALYHIGVCTNPGLIEDFEIAIAGRGVTWRSR